MIFLPLVPHRPLDRERGLERCWGAFEDGEEVVPAGGQLATPADRTATRTSERTSASS